MRLLVGGELHEPAQRVVHLVAAAVLRVEVVGHRVGRDDERALGALDGLQAGRAAQRKRGEQFRGERFQIRRFWLGAVSARGYLAVALSRVSRV